MTRPELLHTGCQDVPRASHRGAFPLVDSSVHHDNFLDNFISQRHSEKGYVAGYDVY